MPQPDSYSGHELIEFLTDVTQTKIKIFFTRLFLFFFSFVRIFFFWGVTDTLPNKPMPFAAFISVYIPQRISYCVVFVSSRCFIERDGSDSGSDLLA